MATVTFDTLKFANQLKTAGVPATHAEAEAKALSEVFETNLGELATKEDLLATKEDLRHEIKELELRIHGEMLLMKWMLGLLLAGVASLILKSFFGA
jgi:hypothetical protein